MEENNLQIGNVESQAGDCACGMREGTGLPSSNGDGMLWWLWGAV